MLNNVSFLAAAPGCVRFEINVCTFIMLYK